MKKYIGAKYTGNGDVVVGQSGNVLHNGDIYVDMQEWEAIGRHDFEPMYENEKPAIAQKKNKEEV